jgi:hypothetical protein
MRNVNYLAALQRREHPLAPSFLVAVNVAAVAFALRPPPPYATLSPS